jgi:hypothetical protein
MTNYIKFLGTMSEKFKILSSTSRKSHRHRLNILSRVDTCFEELAIIRYQDLIRQGSSQEAHKRM